MPTQPSSRGVAKDIKAVPTQEASPVVHPQRPALMASLAATALGAPVTSATTNHRRFPPRHPGVGHEPRSRRRISALPVYLAPHLSAFTVHLGALDRKCPLTPGNYSSAGQAPGTTVHWVRQNAGAGYVVTPQPRKTGLPIACRLATTRQNFACVEDTGALGKAVGRDRLSTIDCTHSIFTSRVLRRQLSRVWPVSCEILAKVYADASSFVLAA